MTFSASGFAGLKRAGTYNGRLERIDDPSDDRLQSGKECPRSGDWVLAEMRFRPVGTDAAQRESPAVGRGQLRTFDDSHFVRCKTGHVVKPVDGVAREEVEQPVLHYALCAAAALFCWLEDEMRRAGKSARGGKMTGRAEEHGRMSVVPASVHLSVHGRPVGTIGRFRHGERVHVGAHPYDSRAVADTQRSHDAGACQTATQLKSCLFQDRRHNFAGPRLLESELGVRVKISPQRDEIRQIGSDVFGKRHEQFLDLVRLWTMRHGGLDRASLITTPVL
jgi:hypothetical protein